MAVPQQWDLYCKLVVTAGLAETLRHAGVTVDAGSLLPRPVDLPATARQADLVFATPDRSTVVHVEVQQRPDPAIGRRMMVYAARIAENPAYGSRIRDLAQVVVQVTGRRPMDTRYRLGSCRTLPRWYTCRPSPWTICWGVQVWHRSPWCAGAGRPSNGSSHTSPRWKHLS